MDKQSAGQATEVHAADALLDRRVRLFIPAPPFLRMLGVRTIPVWIRLPVCAQILRMARLLVPMSVELDKYDKGDISRLFTDISRYLVPCSRIIALGLLRGRVSAFLFHRALASYLLRYMDMAMLAELTKLVVLLSGSENFATIIRSLLLMRITKPTLSREETES
ncbi:MAG: hypothetical protein MdMp024_0927 [Bacteroidales bacterium]